MVKRPQRKNRSQQSHKAAQSEPLAVVGIGVCAASLRALLTLFSTIHEEPAAAYLVAVRQQDGLSVNTVIEELAGRTNLNVKKAENGEALQPYHVYVGGGDEVITLTDGHIASRPAKEPVAHRGTVDSLLISVAEHAHDRSVAVILTGLGSDGTAGVTATKQYGGLSIAQSLNGETDAAEQGAASPAGIVDLLLPIEQIPAQISLYLRGLEAVGAQPEGEISEDVATILTQIAGTLRTVTGNDFHGYKRNTFLRRVQRRMQVLQARSIDDYAAILRKNRDEVHNLFQDLLIGVTQFFRDPKEFDALEKELPALFEGKGPSDQFRVWVLGCATGEEAYSLGILLAEHLQRLDNAPSVQIFATDLDARALGAARAGRYSNAIVDQVSPERLARWFVREGDTYRVAKELREMCIFSPHNLIKDAPFSRIDLLSCRNLLIYLNTELQNRVIPIFHFSLRPGGLLFLGASENVTRHQKLFAPVDRRNRLFRRLETPTKVLPQFPLVVRGAPTETFTSKPPPPPRTGTVALSISRRADQISERYGPAYVIIDTQLEVLHFSGRTGRYLEPVSGAASLNVLNLVHRDLRLDLRSALHQAGEERRRIEHLRIPIQDNGNSHFVNIFVEPILDGNDVTALVVLFQDAGPIPESAPAGQHTGASNEQVERLDAELRLTKERLQATIEEPMRSSKVRTRNISRLTKSCNRPTRNSRPRRRNSNRSMKSCRRSTPSSTLAYAISLEPTATSGTFLNRRRSRRFSSTTICGFGASHPPRPKFFICSRPTSAAPSTILARASTIPTSAKMCAGS